MCLRSPGLIKSPESPLNLDLVWNDVGGSKCLHASKGEDRRDLGIGYTADDLLQRNQKMCGNQYWVNEGFRHGSMPSLPFDGQVKLICACHIQP